jgi:DNA-binding NtrC family response regulator
VGGLKSNPIDVRFISATNRDLEQAVAEGAFRRDLLFRLNGLSLAIPPLRERLDEIEGLATAFIQTRFEEFGLPAPPVLHPDALLALKAHSWPGNIRELRNVMDRALLLSRDGVIEIASLELAPRREPAQSEAPATPQREADEILQALARFGGNQSRAARSLGISRHTLIARMERYGIPRPRKD